MDNSQLPSQGENSTFAGCVGQLRRCASHQGNHTRRVDNATPGLLVTTQTQHGMLAAKPDTLDVNVLCQIPDLLWCIDRIGVVSVHDPRVVEHHVRSTPAILGLDHGLHFRFLGDIALDCFDSGRVGDDFLDFSQGFLESGSGDIGHQDVGTFASEEDTGFETDATAGNPSVYQPSDWEMTYPAAPVMMAFLPWSLPREAILFLSLQLDQSLRLRSVG